MQHFSFMLPENIVRRFFDAGDEYGCLIDGRKVQSTWDNDTRDVCEKGERPPDGLLWEKKRLDQDIAHFNSERS